MISQKLLLKLDQPTLEILLDPQPRDPERVRKLEYIVTQLARPERKADHAFLLGVKRDILRRGLPRYCPICCAVNGRTVHSPKLPRLREETNAV